MNLYFQNISQISDPVQKACRTRNGRLKISWIKL